MPVSDVQAARDWVAGNVIKRTKRNGAAANATHVSHSTASDRVVDPVVDPPVRSWRERVDRATAALRELELAERQGKLLPADLVERAQTKRFIAAKTRFRSMPRKIATQFAPAGKMQQMEEAILEMVDDALRELAGVGRGEAPRGDGEARDDA